MQPLPFRPLADLVFPVQSISSVSNEGPNALNPSNIGSNGGLAHALVFSATETNIRSDLSGVKSAFLYAEEVELASSRLYYVLLAMRTHKSAGRLNDSQRVTLAELERKVGVEEYVESEPKARMVNVGPPSAKSVHAVTELAEGLHKKLFSVAPYNKVIETSLNLMNGKRDTLGRTPVLDQPTLERLENFNTVSLRGRGPFAKSLDRALARRPWLASQLIGNMPAFPEAPWEVLLEMRELLKDHRTRLLAAMTELSEYLDGLDEPPKIAEYPSGLWELKVENELDQIRQKLRALRIRQSLRRLAAAGLPTAAISIEVAAHHPVLAVGAGFSASLISASQLLIQEANYRQALDAQITCSPYWFLRQTSKRWGGPRKG